MSNALTDKAKREFFDAPTVEHYLQLQRSVFDSAEFQPSATELVKVEMKLTSGSPAKLLAQLDSLPDCYQLCPRFHYVEARIRELLGELSQMEASVAKLKGLLTTVCQTGNGTRRSPFLITFFTDQDDVMRSFGEEKRYQQAVTNLDRQLDVITSHEGIEFWFDVTTLARIAARQRQWQELPAFK